MWQLMLVMPLHGSIQTQSLWQFLRLLVRFRINKKLTTSSIITPFRKLRKIFFIDSTDANVFTLNPDISHTIRDCHKPLPKIQPLKMPDDL